MKKLGKMFYTQEKRQSNRDWLKMTPNLVLAHISSNYYNYRCKGNQDHKEQKKPTQISAEKNYKKSN